MKTTLGATQLSKRDWDCLTRYYATYFVRHGCEPAGAWIVLVNGLTGNRRFSAKASKGVRSLGGGDPRTTVTSETQATAGCDRHVTQRSGFYVTASPSSLARMFPYDALAHPSRSRCVWQDRRYGQYPLSSLSTLHTGVSA